MRTAIPILLAVAALGASGCDDGATTVVAPHDVTPPAAPRGLYSTTGDGQASLRWLENTEGDLAGYRIYQSPCASGPGCPYDRVGATSATQFVVSGLGNGVTRFFAVAAVDHAGNESELSYEDIFDTPRPEGVATLGNFVSSTAGAGWDFSAFMSRPSTDNLTDMFFGYNGSVYQMFATSVQVPGSPGTFINTEIQDAGYASSLDAVDWAPSAGWSPTGTVELIPGHCYVVWTWDDHYAKFRVTGLSPTQVTFDWAYQTDLGNPELRARPVRTPVHERRPVTWIRQPLTALAGSGGRHQGGE